MNKSQILDKLEAVEHQYEVKVLYACESGSRVWGFASEDSDYDVRFIYAHPMEWYLSIDVERRFDTISPPIAPLDMAGWDLRKALQLIYKSNPPLWEWLQSPIVYSDWCEGFLKDKMNWLMERYYYPAACFYHYFHMAENNWNNYLLGKSTVLLKKYLYVLQPLLACRWIENAPMESVPVRLEDLCNILLLSNDSLRQIIQKLIEEKRAGCELGESPPIPELHEYLEEEFKRLREIMDEGRFDKYKNISKDPLNEFFRLAIHVAWS